MTVEIIQGGCKLLMREMFLYAWEGICSAMDPLIGLRIMFFGVLAIAMTAPYGQQPYLAAT